MNIYICTARSSAVTSRRRSFCSKVNISELDASLINCVNLARKPLRATTNLRIKHYDETKKENKKRQICLHFQLGCNHRKNTIVLNNAGTQPNTTDNAIHPLR